MHAIECQQLQVSYKIPPILDQLDLVVETGQCFGLVGENGAGKSTLIKSILDLIAIDAGEILLAGKSHRDTSSRQQLAFLPDRFVPPYYLRGKDFLRYMSELYQHEYNPYAVEEMLRLIGLKTEALTKSVRALSKGMTQKLGLAAVFLSGKQTLILDEPMSGLDPGARILIKQQIQRLREAGVTVFFSSHMLSDVEEMADQMAVLHQGVIQYKGTPAGFMTQYEASSMEQAYMHCTGVS